MRISVADGYAHHCMLRQLACSGHNYEHNSFGTVSGMFVHFGEGLQTKKIIFNTDKQSVCHILSSITSQCKFIMVLVRTLTLKCLRLNTGVRGKFLPGYQNQICDS